MDITLNNTQIDLIKTTYDVNWQDGANGAPENGKMEQVELTTKEAKEIDNEAFSQIDLLQRKLIFLNEPKDFFKSMQILRDQTGIMREAVNKIRAQATKDLEVSLKINQYLNDLFGEYDEEKYKFIKEKSVELNNSMDYYGKEIDKANKLLLKGNEVLEKGRAIANDPKSPLPALAGSMLSIFVDNINISVETLNFIQTSVTYMMRTVIISETLADIPKVMSGKF